MRFHGTGIPTDGCVELCRSLPLPTLLLWKLTISRDTDLSCVFKGRSGSLEGLKCKHCLLGWDCSGYLLLFLYCIKSIYLRARRWRKALRVWGGAWGPGQTFSALRKMGASVFAVHPWMLSQDKQPSSRLQIIRDLELRAGEHLPNPKSV